MHPGAAVAGNWSDWNSMQQPGIRAQQQPQPYPIASQKTTMNPMYMPGTQAPPINSSAGYFGSTFQPSATAAGYVPSTYASSPMEPKYPQQLQQPNQQQYYPYPQQAIYPQQQQQLQPNAAHHQQAAQNMARQGQIPPNAMIPVQQQKQFSQNQAEYQPQAMNGTPQQMAALTANQYTGATGVEDLYSSMDNFLPVPTEQQATSSGNNGQNMELGGAGARTGVITVNFLQMPETVRNEFSGLEQRFLFDPNVEIGADMHSYIVKCTLSRR
jgi:hypothetical protein